MNLPVRKKLPQKIPEWMAEGSWFFITINCAPPGKNQLCRADTGDAVLAAMSFNHERLVWHCRPVPAYAGSSARDHGVPPRTGNSNNHQELEKVRRWKTWYGLATRFFRSSLAQPSRTGRENQLHPDESGPQRIVPATGGLGVGLSSERPPAAAMVGQQSLSFAFPFRGKAPQ